MLESIHIQNFKGFKNTQIGPFRKVNLIIGGQNVGKTSLLEAVYSVASLNPYEALSLFRQVEEGDRGRYNKAVSHPEFFVKALFCSEDKSTPIFNNDYGLAIGAMDVGDLEDRFGKKVRYQELTDDEIPNRKFNIGDLVDLKVAPKKSSEKVDRFRAWSIRIVGGVKPVACKGIPYILPPQIQLVQLFGKIILSRKKKELMDLLRKVDARLVSLDAIAPDGNQRIYAELDGSPQALPINMLGHGFSRLVYLFSELFASNAQLALIDEIENGIHYTALPTLFHGIKSVAQERDVQSLITTHSWDCLRAACEVFEDTPDMFQVIRLERHGDDVKAVCIDGERMLRLMAEEREVR